MKFLTYLLDHAWVRVVFDLNSDIVNAIFLLTYLIHFLQDLVSNSWLGVLDVHHGGKLAQTDRPDVEVLDND
jgi:hypothetical protein